MKRRPTKNQLIFYPIGIMRKLSIRYEEHVERHKQYPKKIFLPKQEYAEVKEAFLSWTDGNFHYKGAVILPLE